MKTNLTKEAVAKLCLEEAAKSKCVKRKVGAVIAVENTVGLFDVVAEGHNYNPDIHNDFCENAEGETLNTVIHAEIGCLNEYIGKFLRAKDSKSVRMFVTHQPCKNCRGALELHNVAYEVVEQFMKFDSTKPRMALVPASLNESCARALTYGAKKYKVNNWRKTESIEQYISALQRHFDAWREGEDIDKDSGLNHLDNVAANLSFLIELKDLPKFK